MQASRDAGVGNAVDAVWVWHAAADSPIKPIQTKLAKRIKASSLARNEEREQARTPQVLDCAHSAGSLFLSMQFSP